MIKKNNKDVGFILKETQNIDKIYHGTDLVFEQGFTREDSGFSPLITSHQAIGKNLKDYKIYGNSIQGKLPSGYTQLEYIASTGTQYIDTGVIGKSGITVYTELELTEVPRDGGILECRSSSARFYPIHIYPKEWCIGYGAYYSSGVSVDANTRYSIKSELLVNKQSLTVNNNVVYSDTLSNSINTGLNMYIFGQNTFGSASYLTKVRLYSMTIYESGTKTRDFIPCKDSNNVIGLYDIVNGVFYTNQGTGTFVAGAELPILNPLEVRSVGEKTKNLLTYPYNTMSGTFNNVTFTASKGSFSVTGNATATTTFSRIPFQKVNLKAGTYTLSAKNYGASTNVEDNYIVLYIGTNGYESSNLRNVVFNKEYNFVVTEDSTVYISFLFRRSLNYNITIEELQIEEGAFGTDSYEPYGYKIPVISSGINIWDEQWELGTISDSDGQDASSSTSIRSKGYTPVLPSTIYYSKCPENMVIHFYDANKNWISRTSGFKNFTTITPSNAHYIRFRMVAGYGTTYNNDICINISNPSLDGIYKQYIAPTITNIYLDEPLRKVGNYTDYIDFANSKVVRNIKEVVFNGTETWNAYNSLTNTYAFYNLMEITPLQDRTHNDFALSNRFIQQIRNNVSILDAEGFFIGADNYLYIKIDKTTLADGDVNTFKSWLSVNNVNLYTVLNTPTEESITLPNIPSIKGTTIYTIDTNIQPSNMYVKYKGK